VLRIGDFSRLARVSVKTLRFYAEAGLLLPSHVACSGYRYYRAAQLPALRRVRLLRGLGLSVAEVRELIGLAEGEPAYTARLRQLRRRVLRQLACEEARLHELDALLQGKGVASLPGAMVRRAPLPPRAACTVRARVRQLTEVEEMFEFLERRVARCGGRAPLSPFLLFHDMEYRETQVDVEVCVPLERRALRACGGRIVPGAARAACLRFAGSYAQAPLLYERMLDWMDSARARIAGPVRETYLRFGAAQRGYALPPLLLASGVAEYETELQVPIRGAR